MYCIQVFASQSKQFSCNWFMKALFPLSIWEKFCCWFFFLICKKESLHLSLRRLLYPKDFVAEKIRECAKSLPHLHPNPAASWMRHLTSLCSVYKIHLIILNGFTALWKCKVLCECWLLLLCSLMEGLNIFVLTGGANALSGIILFIKVKQLQNKNFISQGRHGDTCKESWEI